MEAIVSVVLAGLLFRAPGTGPATRGLAILGAVIACFYDSPPLHHPVMARIWMGVLIATALTWFVDMVRARRRGAV